MNDTAPAATPFLHPSLACFVLLAKCLGVAADPEQIAHERGRGDDPYSLEDLHRVAKKRGLIAHLSPARIYDLRKRPLPALIETLAADAAPLVKIKDDAVRPGYLVQRDDQRKHCSPDRRDAVRLLVYDSYDDFCPGQIYLRQHSGSKMPLPNHCEYTIFLIGRPTTGNSYPEKFSASH